MTCNQLPRVSEFDDDKEPITVDWLVAIGFRSVPSDMGSDYDDHLDGVNVWQFNGGPWLWNEYDSVEMHNRGKLRELL